MEFASSPHRALPVALENVERNGAVGGLQTVVSPASQASVSLPKQPVRLEEDIPLESQRERAFASTSAERVSASDDGLDGEDGEKERSGGGSHDARTVEGVTVKSV